MKFLRIVAPYELYLDNFFAVRKELESRSYQEIKAAIEYDGFGHPDCWSHVLRQRGYDCDDLILNCWTLQKAWALENGFDDLVREYNASSPRETFYKITLEQARRFQPEILFFNNPHGELLKKLRQALPRIKLVIGWTGSAFVADILNHVDVVFSCSPEAVDGMRKNGLKANLLPHSFDGRCISRAGPKKYNDEFSFTGQIAMGREFHELRAKILEEVAQRENIQIYTDVESLYKPSGERSDRLRNLRILNNLKKLGLPAEYVKNKYPNRFASETDLQQERKPKIDMKQIHQQVFGMDMFQLLKDSKVSLNIHADSSPRFASNMRMYEVPGMGGCLLTDFKENIGEMFVEDEEIVTYKSSEECIEKYRWLINHEQKRQAICEAGQKRVLAEYTFERRAPEFERLVKLHL